MTKNGWQDKIYLDKIYRTKYIGQNIFRRSNPGKIYWDKYTQIKYILQKYIRTKYTEIKCIQTKYIGANYTKTKYIYLKDWNDCLKTCQVPVNSWISNVIPEVRQRFLASFELEHLALPERKFEQYLDSVKHSCLYQCHHHLDSTPILAYSLQYPLVLQHECCQHGVLVSGVLGQNGRDKMVRTKWYGQNGTDRIIN